MLSHILIALAVCIAFARASFFPCGGVALPPLPPPPPLCLPSLPLPPPCPPLPVCAPPPPPQLQQPCGGNFGHNFNAPPRYIVVRQPEQQQWVPPPVQIQEQQPQQYVQQPVVVQQPAVHQQVVPQAGPYKQLGSKTNDPSCNSERLRTIILENIGVSATESKRKIHQTALETFGGTIDVICSSFSFSYIISTPEFCEVQKSDLTCFVFRQP